MSLYIDLTEFLTNPITTGIQRISGELCKHLPPSVAIPVRLYSGQYVALPSGLIRAIGEYFRDASESGADKIRQVGAVEKGSVIKVSSDDTVLVPEVFFDPQRLSYFRNIPEDQLKRYRFIIYDLLPLTHPEYFGSDIFLNGLCEYFQIARRISHCGFISEYTRDVYYGRLKRTNTRDGVVLPLGSDALGPKVDRPTLNRPLTFSVLGTIEPRKNHELILEAFEPLLRQIDGLSLSFIGKMGWVDSEFAQKVRKLAAEKNSGFRFYPAPGDDTIRSHIEQSRATIYLSTAEGYGLPPVESLWVGTPVIASPVIPSLKRLGPAGIHYVQPLSAVNLRRAVLAFLEDDYANRKTEETMDLNLPTWYSFTQEVLRWCTEELR
jgi:glycosyltransferase involved in cell wall biosynthesis